MKSNDVLGTPMKHNEVEWNPVCLPSGGATRTRRTMKMRGSATPEEESIDVFAAAPVSAEALMPPEEESIDVFAAAPVSAEALMPTSSTV